MSVIHLLLLYSRDGKYQISALSLFFSHNPSAHSFLRGLNPASKAFWTHSSRQPLSTNTDKICIPVLSIKAHLYNTCFWHFVFAFAWIFAFTALPELYILSFPGPGNLPYFDLRAPAAKIHIQQAHKVTNAWYLGKNLGEGNGNPLQYFCLENPVDRGAWWAAAVHGVTQSRTWLKRLSMQACFREGNGNSLQYSCLENPRDRGASGLPSMGSHRVGHDWSDLAAATGKNLKLTTKIPSLISNNHLEKSHKCSQKRDGKNKFYGSDGLRCNH